MEGKDAKIENATDNEWITMTFTTWPEIANMTNKHCRPVDPPEGQIHENVEIEDCMIACTRSASCMSISHNEQTRMCIMAPYCTEEDDAVDQRYQEGSFDSFDKGIKKQ
jgi:hypothetical protein